MSSIAIIITIVVVLGILVCYAFISQTVQNKKEQRARFKTALITRARNFKHILEGFPAGFLPNELKLLVQKSLVEIFGQLTELEPTNEEYANQLQLMTQEMAAAQRQDPNQVTSQLDNPQIIKEAKNCLEELFKFVFHLEGRGRVGKSQADSYRNSIKQLVVQLSVDSYIISGRHAHAAGKARLSLHHYNQALKIMKRENNAGQFNSKISSIEPLIGELTIMAAAEDERAANAQPTEAAEGESENEAWKAIKDESNNSWRKKQVYD